MTFFFDHNLPACVADALTCLGIPATHLAKEGFPNDTSDEVWMLAAADRGYIVVTRDRSIYKRAAQRQLYRQLALRGPFLGPAFSRMRLRDLAKWLLWHWEKVEEVMRVAEPGDAYLLHQKGRLERL